MRVNLLGKSSFRSTSRGNHRGSEHPEYLGSKKRGRKRVLLSRRMRDETARKKTLGGVFSKKGENRGVGEFLNVN